MPEPKRILLPYRKPKTRRGHPYNLPSFEPGDGLGEYLDPVMDDDDLRRMDMDRLVGDGAKPPPGYPCPPRNT